MRGSLQEMQDTTHTDPPTVHEDQLQYLSVRGNQQLKLHSGMLIFAMLKFEDCYHLPIQTMTHLH